MTQESVLRIVAPYLIPPVLVIPAMVYAAWSINATDRETAELDAASAEQVQSFESELVHARTADKQRFDGSPVIHFPVFWTDDQNHVTQIAIAAAEHEFERIALIVAPEAERLGPNAYAEECWLFEAEALRDADPENALARGTLVMAEPGGFWRSDNWCEEHGLWEE